MSPPIVCVFARSHTCIHSPWQFSSWLSQWGHSSGVRMVRYSTWCISRESVLGFVSRSASKKLFLDVMTAKTTTIFRRHCQQQSPPAQRRIFRRARTNCCPSSNPHRPNAYPPPMQRQLTPTIPAARYTIPLNYRSRLLHRNRAALRSNFRGFSFRPSAHRNNSAFASVAPPSAPVSQITRQRSNALSTAAAAAAPAATPRQQVGIPTSYAGRAAAAVPHPRLADAALPRADQPTRQRCYIMLVRRAANRPHYQLLPQCHPSSLDAGLLPQ